MIACTRFAKTDIILAKAVSERKNRNLEHFSTHDFYARPMTFYPRRTTFYPRHTTKTQTPIRGLQYTYIFGDYLILPYVNQCYSPTYQQRNLADLMNDIVSVVQEGGVAAMKQVLSYNMHI